MQTRDVMDDEGGFFRHLTQSQMEELTRVFREWYKSSPTTFARRVRGRYWISFLCLRYTGARIGEVMKINDITDVDYKGETISIRVSRENRPKRIIPVPPHLMATLSEYLDEFPSMKGKIFTLDQGNFRREFYRRAEEAEIPRKLSHPHVLRHTRAMEMVRAGVPIGLIRSILGHAGSATVLLYLEQYTRDPKEVLHDKGLLY